MYIKYYLVFFFDKQLNSFGIIPIDSSYFPEIRKDNFLTFVKYAYRLLHKAFYVRKSKFFKVIPHGQSFLEILKFN